MMLISHALREAIMNHNKLNIGDLINIRLPRYHKSHGPLWALIVEKKSNHYRVITCDGNTWKITKRTLDTICDNSKGVIHAS